MPLKIYAVGDSDELTKLRHLCSENGWEFHLMNRIGRPSADIPVQNLLDAYARHKNISAAARATKLSTGTAWRRLKQAGVI